MGHDGRKSACNPSQTDDSQLCSLETACEKDGQDVCAELFPCFVGPVKGKCPPKIAAPSACVGEYCGKGMLNAGDCCKDDGDCGKELLCNSGHRTCEPKCKSNTECPAPPSSAFEEAMQPKGGEGAAAPPAESKPGRRMAEGEEEEAAHGDCDGYHEGVKLCAMERKCAVGGPDTRMLNTRGVS